MCANWFEKWKKVEKPTHPKQYKSGNPLAMVKYCIIGIISSFIFLIILDLLGKNNWYFFQEQTKIPHYMTSGFMYLLLLSTMMVPLIAGGIVSVKTQRPSNGFALLFGFIIAAIIYLFFNMILAIYLILMIIILIITALPSPGNYELKPGYLIYHFILGIIICYLNFEITIYFKEDVWCYLQFIYLHLTVSIIIAMKIRQWGYMYMFGWLICASVYLFIPGQLVNGIYYLFTPALLSWTIMHYFFHIWKPMRYLEK